MLLSPIIGIQLRPKLSCWFNQSRTVRPSIKIGKEKFQLQIDVKNYCKDEIRVKVAPDYVIIEGRQQKQTKRGLIVRQFVRKFRLPAGCVNECMESKLSPEGVLTITAPRKHCGPNATCETLIPIKPDFSAEADASFVPVQRSPANPAECPQGPCAKFTQDSKAPCEKKK